jgi:16S rRNA (uracil1498-N3)-methyltransferase
MLRLFLPIAQFAGDTVSILGADHTHLVRVLRARPGAVITLLDNRGNAFRAVLVSIDKAETQARIEARIPTPPEPAVFITVAQALGKGDKFEQVIQHGTEAGASAFVPVRAERCVVEFPQARAAERIARWRQIARGAAEQSGRARIAEVEAPLRLEELLERATGPEDLGLFLHPGEETVPLRAALGRPDRPSRLWLAIGPEGGWSPKEVASARQANWVPVTLGARILRTETAALVAISQILYALET